MISSGVVRSFQDYLKANGCEYTETELYIETKDALVVMLDSKQMRAGSFATLGAVKRELLDKPAPKLLILKADLTRNVDMIVSWYKENVTESNRS